MELFGPKTRRVIELMGKRADDPEVVALVEELGKKPITGTTDAGGMKHVAVSKQGIDLGFDHDVLNDQFPRIKLKGQACMPYLTNAWLDAKWEPPPPEDRIAAKLGPPRNDCFTLDAARHVEVEVGSRVVLGIIQARRIALASMAASATVASVVLPVLVTRTRNWAASPMRICPSAGLTRVLVTSMDGTPFGTVAVSLQTSLASVGSV